MAGGFEAVRKRKSRAPIGTVAVLWPLTIFTSFFVGFAAMLLVGIALFPVSSLTDAVGLGSSWLTPVVQGVYFAFIAWAVIAPPCAVAWCDRTSTWLTRAHDPDPSDERDARIVQGIQAIALASGTDPIIMICDAEFVDAASAGRRDGRPVVIVTRAAATLERRLFTALAATALADAMNDRGSSLARAFGTGATGLPMLAVYRVAQAVRRRPGRTLAAILGAFIVLGSVATATARGEMSIVARIFFAPVFVVLFVFLLGFIVAIAVGVLIAWLLLLGSVAFWLAARARSASDVVAIELARDPHGWLALMQNERARTTRPDIVQRMLVGWSLPRTPGEANRRVAACAAEVPGVRAALGPLASSEPA